MDLIENLKQKIKGKGIKVIFPEGSDEPKALKSFSQKAAMNGS